MTPTASTYNQLPTSDELSVEEVAALVRKVGGSNPRGKARKVVSVLGENSRLHVDRLEKAMRVAGQVVTAQNRALVEKQGRELRAANRRAIASGRRMGYKNNQQKSTHALGTRKMGPYEGTGRWGDTVEKKYTEMKRASSDPTASASDPAWSLLHNWH